MKQYVYRIFLMLGLALWLVSCTGTETPIDDLGNIPEESIPSGTGNMFSLAMRIPLPNDYMGTKAYEGVDRGSVSEILIDGVRMVLYEGDVVKYCLDLDIQVQPDNNDLWTRMPGIPHPCQHLLLSDVFMLIILPVQ